MLYQQRYAIFKLTPSGNLVNFGMSGDQVQVRLVGWEVTLLGSGGEVK